MPIARIHIVFKGTPKNWEVKLIDVARRWTAAHKLRRCGADGNAFPQWPKGAAVPPDLAGAPRDPPLEERAENWLEQLLTRQSTDPAGDMRRLGRYVFGLLFNNPTWGHLVSQPAGTTVELALRWQADDHALNRVPWEMLHSEAGFVAAQQAPPVMITRRVHGTRHWPTNRYAPLRVLLVVGSGLDDAVIRPGAEYVGLIRSVEHTGHRLVLSTLLNATREKLRQKVITFQPDIVHFIGHGNNDTAGRGFVKIQRGANDEEEECYGDEMATLLDPDRAQVAPPNVVVVNACHSARTGRESPSFAAELVRAGIPVVVGMAGEVADPACRLFTRRFYEALVTTGNVGHAVAQGRRAGVALLAPSTIDWALPTVYVSGAICDASLPFTVSEAVERRLCFADEVNVPGDYPHFCDREELFHWFDTLLADAKKQKSLTDRDQEFHVLALVSPNNESGKYGRTRTLRQLAARALRAGHVVCFVGDWDGYANEFPKDWPAFLGCLLKAGDRMAQYLAPDLDMWPSLRALANEPSEAPSWTKQAVALRADLLQLRKAVCAGLPATEADRVRVVIVIDDVHRLSTAVKPLIEVLGPAGLRHVQAADKTRVVLAYAEKPQNNDPGEQNALQLLQNWCKPANRVEVHTFEKFPNDQLRLIYTHFLLNYRENNRHTGRRAPLVIRPPDRPDAQDLLKNFYELLDDSVNEVPSKLAEPSIAHILKYNLKAPPEVRVVHKTEDPMEWENP